jgi:ABC-type Fe3+ transport system permease subunit
MFKIILNKIAKLSALILVAGILTPATTMAATANIQDSLCTGSDLKITASDDAVKKAKNTIIYALIGLVIVALSQLIVHFVLAKTIQASHGIMMLHILP